MRIQWVRSYTWWWWQGGNQIRKWHLKELSGSFRFKEDDDNQKTIMVECRASGSYQQPTIKGSRPQKLSLIFLRLIYGLHLLCVRHQNLFFLVSKRLILNTGHSISSPDGSDMQIVPENSVMTYGVLIELAGLGERGPRWVGTSANLSEGGWREWMESWVEKWLQSFARSPSASGQTSFKDRDESNERERVEKGESETWKRWQWCTAAQRHAEGFRIRREY